MSRIFLIILLQISTTIQVAAADVSARAKLKDAVEMRLAHHTQLLQDLEQAEEQQKQLDKLKRTKQQQQQQQDVTTTTTTTDEPKWQRKLSDAQALFQELVGLTRTTDDLLRSRLNVMAIRHLQTVLETLLAQELDVRKQVEEAEQESIKRYKEQQRLWEEVSQEVMVGHRAEQKRHRKQKQKGRSQRPSLTETQLAGIVSSHDDLEMMLSLPAVFAEHDAKMEAFCHQHLVEAAQDAPLPNAVLPETDTPTHQEGGCATPTQAAQVVQSALAQRRAQEQEQDEAFYDHASHAAWIVHDATSETYRDNNKNAAPTDDHPWWLDYVPDDWIDGLVYLQTGLYDGHEDLMRTMGGVSEGRQPSFSHDEKEDLAMAWLSKNVLSMFTGHSGGHRSVNPPEMVLHPLTLPGACWPVSMQPEGGGLAHVTLALSYPMSVTAITVDHASRLLLMKEEDKSSAPKVISVVGYPPCEDATTNCHGRTYDPTDPVELMRLEYDLNGTISQRFPVVFAEDHVAEKKQTDMLGAGSCSAAPPQEDDDEEEEASTATAASCSAPPPTPEVSRDDTIAALRFDIVENYGNEDYTCLYRLRVHGEPMTQQADDDDEWK